VEAREQIAEQLHTLRDYLRWGITQLQRAEVHYGHGTDNAFDEVLALLLHCLALPHEHCGELFDARLTRGERLRVLDALAARCQQRLPLPYITGEAWFAGLPFHVDETVLIPRSPIAELIEAGFEPWLGGHAPRRILDLCAGSGCIGIACALYLDAEAVVLADISAAALGVAARNIARHGVEERVRSVRSDLFAGVAGERFDLIVSNPPYVDAEELAALPAEYRHEPQLALAAGADGLDLVRRILRAAAAYLTEHGILIVEVGNSMAALEQAYPAVPFLWLEFARGGHGVFLLTRAQLLEHAAQF
jgi:ribosomal protein L3 glutamine methyltransferase